MFVPGYDSGRPPYGVWPVRRVITDQDWASSFDPDDDVAFVELTRAVQGVTGGERLGTGQPPGQLVTVIGYPENRDSAIFCQNYSRSFSATQLVFRCGGYTAGTSGSPLLAQVDAATGLGTVIGVIGGYQRGGVTAIHPESAVCNCLSWLRYARLSRYVTGERCYSSSRGSSCPPLGVTAGDGPFRAAASASLAMPDPGPLRLAAVRAGHRRAGWRRARRRGGRRRRGRRWAGRCRRRPPG